MAHLFSHWRSFPSTDASLFKILFWNRLFILEIILLVFVIVLFLSWNRSYIRCIHYKRIDSHFVQGSVCVGVCVCFFVCCTCICVLCACVWLTGQPPGSCWCKEGFGGLRCDRWDARAWSDTVTVWQRSKIFHCVSFKMVRKFLVGFWMIAFELTLIFTLYLCTRLSFLMLFPGVLLVIWASRSASAVTAALMEAPMRTPVLPPVCARYLPTLTSTLPVPLQQLH